MHLKCEVSALFKMQVLKWFKIHRQKYRWNKLSLQEKGLFSVSNHMLTEIAESAHHPRGYIMLRGTRTSEQRSVDREMSVAFDNNSREVDSDDWNLINSSYKSRNQMRFQNPDRGEHFPSIPALLQFRFTGWQATAKLIKFTFMMDCRCRLSLSNWIMALNWTACLVFFCDAVCWIGAATMCLGLLLLTLILVAHSECTSPTTGWFKRATRIQTLVTFKPVGSTLPCCRHQFG